MKNKKPEWLKKGNALSFKVKSAPMSFSMDEELRTLKEHLPKTDTQLGEKFICEKSNLTLEELGIKIRKFIISLTNIKKGDMSKEFRIYLSNEIKQNEENPDIKKRMEEKIREEKNEV